MEEAVFEVYKSGRRLVRFSVPRHLLEQFIRKNISREELAWVYSRLAGWSIDYSISESSHPMKDYEISFVLVDDNRKRRVEIKAFGLKKGSSEVLVLPERMVIEEGRVKTVISIQVV